MRLVALIPARYNSSRFPGKPLADLAGQPLILRVWAQARQVPEIDAVYVATDDERIAATVRAAGGEAIMTRPDHPSGTDRIAEAAAILGLPPGTMIINIQGDMAVFPPALISQVAAPFRAGEHPAIVTPVRRLDPELAADPNIVKAVFDQRGYALYFSRAAIPHHRDNETGVYYKHIGIYGYQLEFLHQFVKLPPGRWEQAEKLEQLRALEYGYSIKVVETEADTWEVDTPEDARRVAYLLNRTQPANP